MRPAAILLCVALLAGALEAAMSNILVDTSFEDNNAAWVATDELIFGIPYDPFTTDQARTGSQSGLMRQANANDNALLVQTVDFSSLKAPIEIGQPLFLGVWVYAKDADSGTLALLFDVAYSNIVTTIDATGKIVRGVSGSPNVLTTQGPSPVGRWTPLILNTKVTAQITAATSDAEFGVAISVPGDAGSHWYVDDVYFSVVDPFTIPLTYPDNGQGPLEFRRSIIDPVTGRLVKEGDLAFDPERPSMGLRAAADVDQPGRDWALRNWSLPREVDPPDP